MILAIDVAYLEDKAQIAGVLFASWDAQEISQELFLQIDEVAEYVPGQFYKRELPCIKKLLEIVTVPLTCIVVDGYVTLGADEKPGLGQKLWEMIEGKTPVIGVAKSRFHDTPVANEIKRGDSERPLYVTAVGMPLEEAKEHIRQLKGKYRLPDFLKAVDGLCRKVVE